ncbi:hypothetical protein DZF43_005312 [Escherichia coli]|nr:hypothetical protein [Escherichia coli]
MTENVKSELLLLMADNNEATSSILADPYGKISHKTLDIITTTLTPLMLQRLKHNINAWVNEELSLNRPGFPGECFICELRLPDHRF